MKSRTKKWAHYREKIKKLPPEKFSKRKDYTEVASMSDLAAMNGSAKAAHAISNGNLHNVKTTPYSVYQRRRRNMLIFKNKASLLTNAEDFCLEMGWTDDVQHQKQLSEGIQQELFADDYSAEEQAVLQALARDDSKQINVLAVETNIAIGELSSLLFSLEMKGAVQSLVGGRYKLRR